MPSKPSSSRGGQWRPSGGSGGGETGDRIADSRSQYQVGAEIGRGGFGVVFQALNVEVGDFVAVKRFPLSSINAESLGAIEVSISER
jgi:serine/threonine protein kinase